MGTFFTLLSILFLLQLPSEPRCKVNIIGDSQVGNIISYARSDAKKHDWQLSSSWVSGVSIRYWIPKYKKIGAEVTIVMLGSNDVDGKPTAEKLASQIEGQCIWVGPTNVYGRGNRVNQLIKNSVSDRCMWLDSQDIPLTDKIHPTIKGREIWWGRISALISKKCS